MIDNAGRQGVTAGARQRIFAGGIDRCDNQHVRIVEGRQELAEKRFRAAVTMGLENRQTTRFPHPPLAAARVARISTG
jgi:hypothetical protein